MATEREPALAFYLVAEILGPNYFEHAPPRQGRRVEVTGLDGLITVWDCTLRDADRVLVTIANRRDAFARSELFDRDKDKA